MRLIINGDTEAKNEVFKNLKRVYPDGDLKLNEITGEVTFGPNAKPPEDSSTPLAAEKLKDIIKSEDKIVSIFPNVADPEGSGPKGPTTTFADPEGAINGKGTSSSVFVPGPKSTMEFGFFDKKGAMKLADNVRILWHELLGHAWLGLKGMEDPRGAAKIKGKRRPGHDITIKIENQIEEEQARLDKRTPIFRGLDGDPKHGEAWDRKKAPPPAPPAPPFKKEIKGGDMTNAYGGPVFRTKNPTLFQRLLDALANAGSGGTN